MTSRARRTVTMSDDSIVNQLRENLGNYPEDTVLRELQQNADDAGATLFGLIYDDEITNKRLKNPYYRASKLIIFNDGPVSDVHWNALFEMRSASQIADDKKIGKFGLGLKSIFHWCDVCWCMQINPTDNWSAIRSDIIVSPNIHDSEKLVPDLVSEAVQARVQLLIKSKIPNIAKNLFVLVLSLRDLESNEHLANICQTEPIERIPSRFPECLSKDHVSLARNLPCLSSLEEVLTVDSTNVLKSNLRIQKTKDGHISRLKRFASKESRKFWSLGQIETHVGETLCSTLPYALAAEEFIDHRLIDLARSVNWPTVRTKVNGVSKDVKERSVQSGGIILIGNTTREVSIRHATYLPLREVVQTAASKTQGLDIYIHGTFQVDSGRNQVLTVARQASDVERITWNNILFGDLISPNILGDLFDLSTHFELGRDFSGQKLLWKSIVKYREKSQNYFDHESLATKQQLVLRVSQNGLQEFQLPPSESHVTHLPTTIVNHRNHFLKFGALVNANIYSSFHNTNILSKPLNRCENPLNHFELSESIPVDVLKSILIELVEDSQVHQTPKSDGIQLATCYRNQNKTTDVPLIDDLPSIVKSLCKLVIIKFQHNKLVKRCINVLNSLLTSGEILVLCQKQSDVSEQILQDSSESLLSRLENRLQGSTESGRSASNLCLALLSESNPQSTVPFKHSTSRFVPVFNKLTNDYDLYRLNQARTLYNEGRLKLPLPDLNQLIDIATNLDESVIRTVSEETAKYLKLLWKQEKLNVNHFISRISTIQQVTTNTTIRLNATSALLDIWKASPENAESVESLIIKLTSKFGNGKMVLVADDEGQQEVTVCKLLGLAVVDRDNSELLIDGARQLIINKRDCITNNKRILFADSITVLQHLKTITIESSKNYTLDADSRTKLMSYFTNVLGLQNSMFRMLPVFESNFGTPFAPTWAIDGFISIREQLDLPIVSEELSNCLNSLSVDHVLFMNDVFERRDCLSPEKVFQWLVATRVADRPWNSEAKTTLLSIVTAFKNTRSLAIDTVAQTIASLLFPSALRGNVVFRHSACPIPLLDAIRNVAQVDIYDEGLYPLIDDICSIDDGLFEQLVPCLTPCRLFETLSQNDLLEPWIAYWKGKHGYTPDECVEMFDWLRTDPDLVHSEFINSMPVHRTYKGTWGSPTYTDTPVASKSYTWLRHYNGQRDFYVKSQWIPEKAISETELFEYLFSEIDSAVIGRIISDNLFNFVSVLDQTESLKFIKSIPFVRTPTGDLTTLNQILKPSEAHPFTDKALAKLLGLHTEFNEDIVSLKTYQRSRLTILDRLEWALQYSIEHPELCSLGQLFTYEQIQDILAGIKVSSHPILQLLCGLHKDDHFSEKDLQHWTKLFLGNAGLFHGEAVAKFTSDLANNHFDASHLRLSFISGLVVQAGTHITRRFFVPTCSGSWNLASKTYIHGDNFPDSARLHPKYSGNIACSFGTTRLDEFADYFQHDVWSDFQTLWSATIALVCFSQKAFNIADKGLPLNNKAVELTAGIKKSPKLHSTLFYVRNMDSKCKARMCDGKDDFIRTSSDQLKSLVDHIDTTTDQIKVYLVLPTTSVDPNKLRSLLLDLAPTIYRELGMDSKECRQRLQGLSDDGQTTITETQQIALSRFQTTLQMIGQSRMPKLLRDYAEEITSQQLRLSKFQRNILERHQQVNGGRLEDHEIRLIHQSKQTQDQVVYLLESDSSIHQQSIEAIRDATTRYSYDKLSFAFELIQNADDALEQLKDLDEFPDGDVEVVVDISNGAFILSHPGRPINYYQNKNRVIEKFKNDLVYMLTLNLTDKSDVEVSSKDQRQYHQVTGKYGLGFKSVYHVTNDVKITSGELATEFRCGIWPMKLDNESRARLDAWRDIRGIPKTSTVIQLGGVTEVPRDFTDALVLLPLSTRNIRTIKYIDATGNETTYKCKVQKLAEHVNIIETTSCRTFLQVVGTDQYTWQCFEIKNGIPVSVKDISNYWVTVPTRVNYKPGFVCNATFPLNSARTAVEHNDFMYMPFCTEFAKVMAPAYMRLFEYLKSALVKPELQIHNKASAVDRGQEIRNHLEDMLKGDGKLFAFLKLQGLSTTHQEQMIEGLANHLTDQQVAVAKAEQAAEKQTEKPSLHKSEIDMLMESLDIVDESWHKKVDFQLYGEAMSADWDYHIANFDYETPASCQTWQRLILRSMFESIGFQSITSKSNIINKRYIEQAINLTKSPINNNYPIELANFLRKPFWDETDSEEFTSTFYFGELFSTAMLTSNLEETVEHIRITLQNFSINRLLLPREAGFAHLLRGALGPKAIAFMLREVLRCISRVDGAWLDSYSRPEQYACVVDSNLEKMFDLRARTDHERSEQLSQLISLHGFTPKDIGFDIQIRDRLKSLRSLRTNNVYR